MILQHFQKAIDNENVNAKVKMQLTDISRPLKRKKVTSNDSFNPTTLKTHRFGGLPEV